MNKNTMHIAVLGVLFITGPAAAVEFDGFLTAGMAAHDQKFVTYLDGVTEDVSFDNDSKFGLQISAKVAENMQAVAQILARGSSDNYDMDIAWAYLDYRLTDGLSLRGGKVKEPVFLISDYFEVGYAYPWIRPPQEVYRNNPINTINGLQMQYSANLGAVTFLLQPYLGSNTDEVPGTGGQADFHAEKFYGAAMQLSNPSFTFQVSGLKTNVNTVGYLPASFTTDPMTGLTTIGFLDLTREGTATLMSAGLSWDIANFVGYTEFVTRDIEATTGASAETLFPDQDAYYLTLGYRIGKWLPHLTFAHSESTPLVFNVADPSSYGNAMANTVAVDQDSITVGMRYELNDSAALKMEYHAITLDKDKMPVLTPAGYVGGNGLYSDTDTFGGALPKEKSAMVSIAIDVIF